MFSTLVEPLAGIDQTVHNGALASPIVVSPKEKASEIPKVHLHLEVAGPNPAALIYFLDAFVDSATFLASIGQDLSTDLTSVCVMVLYYGCSLCARRTTLRQCYAEERSGWRWHQAVTRTVQYLAVSL